jgi:hypothetical protein
MDGVMNDRTIRVSNIRPRAIVVPIWPSTRRSLKMNDVMVKANTSPAAVTTEPLPAMERMMPVLMPAWIASLNRDQQHVVVRPHGQQQDDGQRQYHPIQLDTQEVLPRIARLSVFVWLDPLRYRDVQLLGLLYELGRGV